MHEHCEECHRIGYQAGRDALWRLILYRVIVERDPRLATFILGLLDDLADAA